MPESTFHQIHFAWAEPTLLGRVGPGPAASSLTEGERLTLRAWRNRLQPALTVDYRVCLPDPAEHPETLWVRAYEDGQAALVYRWPGEVGSAHAWAIVGPAEGLTLPRVLSLHENPNTRPHRSRPPAPGWAAMPVLDVPEPWDRSAAPGAVRSRDRRAADLAAPGGEELLALGVAAALERPDLPVRVFLDPGRADLWNAVQLRFLWGLHRSLYEVLSPRGTSPAPGWEWSLSTYDPVLEESRQHIVFGPPTPAAGPLLRMPGAEFRTVAERLVGVLREEGGDALAEHLAERGVPDAPTFGERRDLLVDWLDPRPAVPRAGDGAEAAAPAVGEAGSGDGADGGADGPEPAAETAQDAPRHPPEPPAATPLPPAPAARPDGAARLRRFVTDVAPAHPTDPGTPTGGERAATHPVDGGDLPGRTHLADAEASTGPMRPIAPAGLTGVEGSAAYPVDGDSSFGRTYFAGAEVPTGSAGGEVSAAHPASSSHLPGHTGLTSTTDTGDPDDPAVDLPEAEPLPPSPVSTGGARFSEPDDPAEVARADASGDPGGFTTAGADTADPGGHTGPASLADTEVSAFHSTGLGDTGGLTTEDDLPEAEPLPTDPTTPLGADAPRGSAADPCHTDPTDPTRITGTERAAEAARPTDSGGSAVGDDLPEAEALPGDTGGGSAPPSFRFPNASRPRDLSDDLPARAWAFREAAAEAASPLPEVEPPGTDETGPQAPPEPAVPSGRTAVEVPDPDSDPDPGTEGPLWPGIAPATPGGADPDEALWPSAARGPAPESTGVTAGPRHPRIVPTIDPGPDPGSDTEPSTSDAHRSVEGHTPRIFDAPEPRRPRIAPAADPEPPPEPESFAPAPARRSPSPIRTGLFRKRTARRDTPAGGVPRAAEPDTPRSDGRVRALAEGAFGGRPTRSTPQPPDPEEFPPAAERTPDEAPPLFAAADPDDASGPYLEPPDTPDYATETAPEPSERTDPEGNWPTQYVDLPLARLERWLTKYGPDEARIDLVDARAAVRAERSELQRVRDERDHYHAELQDSRREVARLDRSWIDREDDDEPLVTGSPKRRWPVRALVVLLLFAFLITGLEAGARFGVSALDLLQALINAL